MAEAVTAEQQAPATTEPQFKVKVKKPRQRSCNENDASANQPAKSKVCCGHLKRWYDYPADAEAAVRKFLEELGWKFSVGRKPEVYRCEICKTLYVPDAAELPRSYTHRF